MASLRVTCQALPAPSSTPRSATNMPAFMVPANANRAPTRGVAALANGNPFTSAQRESNASFWRPDCPPDEDDVRSAPFSVWPRKVAKKVERPSATWQPGSSKAFRNTIEEVRTIFLSCILACEA